MTAFVRLIVSTGLCGLAAVTGPESAASSAEGDLQGHRPLMGNNPAARTAWKKQEPIPTPWYFYDVDMLSVNEGWSVSHPIIGDYANIWHTTDGGKSWKQQGTLFRQLNAVAFADALHGVAVGNEYRYTIDGVEELALQSEQRRHGLRR